MTTSKAEPLTIDGLANVRDLGGLTTQDGRRVRSRQVIRSDSPLGMTEQGQTDLSAVVAPGLVIDLRTSLEVEHEGYLIGHVPSRVINLPMNPQSGMTQEQFDAGAADNLVDDYVRSIEANAESMISALRLIADQANRPVVIHCTAGKDRTGVLTAMLLGILGVDIETIVADYHVTQSNMGPILKRVRASRLYQDQGLASAPSWIFEAEPDTMRAFLTHVSALYGTAEGWALAKGLSMEDITRLRESLLDS
ncbi:MAG: protein-tyrosine phosphatase [Actinomycetota bacterium]|jgi:protein-tyrosine phosphatase|nr:protein-tyrosine phosphatase [Actinomycetota bacterium]